MTPKELIGVFGIHFLCVQVTPVDMEPSCCLLFNTYTLSMLRSVLPSLFRFHKGRPVVHMILMSPLFSIPVNGLGISRRKHEITYDLKSHPADCSLSRLVLHTQTFSN
jgi:hypothetical protein